MDPKMVKMGEKTWMVIPAVDVFHIWVLQLCHTLAILHLGCSELHCPPNSTRLLPLSPVCSSSEIQYVLVSVHAVVHINFMLHIMSDIKKLLLSSFDLWLDGNQDSFNLGWAARSPIGVWNLKCLKLWPGHFTDDLSNLPSWLFLVLLKLLMSWMSWHHFFLCYKNKNRKWCPSDSGLEYTGFDKGGSVTDYALPCDPNTQSININKY